MINQFLLSVLIGLGLALSIVGCDSSDPPAPDASRQRTQGFAPESVTFRAHVESNRQDDGALDDLAFVDTQGKAVRLEQYRGKQNVLLVFTRGFDGSLCPYCTTQTSRLIANYERFKTRNTEILLVYPGAKEQLPQFRRASLQASANDSTSESVFPFPVLLDEDLVAVEKLGIAAHLAYPSTFLIDRNGNVRLSYVGSAPADRPSIAALLEQIDAI